MLVLTRKEGQIIHVGEDIIIKVVRLDRSRRQVVIGIEAPDDVNIVRAEIKKDGNQ